MLLWANFCLQFYERTERERTIKAKFSNILPLIQTSLSGTQHPVNCFAICDNCKLPKHYNQNLKIIYPSGCQHRAHPGKLIQREYGQRKFKQRRNIYAFRWPLVRHVSTRNCACAVTLPRVTGKSRKRDWTTEQKGARGVHRFFTSFNSLVSIIKYKEYS